MIGSKFDEAITDLHLALLRGLCRRATTMESYYADNGKVRIELTAHQLKAHIFYPQEGWTDITARPTGKYSDQQFLAHAVRMAQVNGVGRCILDPIELTYIVRLGLARVVLLGPMSAIV